MKKCVISYFILFLFGTPVLAQNSKQAYPEPEFVKEVYAYNKENNSLVRLQKETSQLETKSKFGGFGGAESGYNIEGERSSVRFSSSRIPTFVFRNREDHASADNSMPMGMDSMSMENDSMSKMMASMGSLNSMMDDMMDPSKMISLYALDTKKGTRSLVMQGSSGAFSKKQKSSNKYSLSFRKVKDGYYEIVVDKMLPKGEYGFMNSGIGTMEMTLFAFGVD